MQTFKGFLTEQSVPTYTKKGEATFVEDVIIHCINTYNKSKDENKFVEISKQEPELVKFVTDHSSKIKISKDIDQGMKDLYVFAKTLHQKIGGPASSEASSAGKTKPKVSGFWKDKTTKGVDTSKADILLGSTQVSVKKRKAQLMSGERKESMATLEAAFKESDLASTLQSDIIGVVNEFATRTKTEDWNTTQLSEMDPKKFKKEINVQARKTYDKAQFAAAEVKELMAVAMENKQFKNAFAYEAMTGWEKFGGNTFGNVGDNKGYADSMLVVDDSLSRVKFDTMSSPSAPLVGDIAKKMNFSVTMKSNSYSSKTTGKSGYGFYQTVRLGVDTIFNDTEDMLEEFNEEYKKLETMLSEGWMSEGAFWDSAKKLWNKVKVGFLAAVHKAVEIFHQAIDHVKELLKESFEYIVDYFNIDYTVKANVRL